MHPEVVPQETRVFTRMEHPLYVRVMRYVWIGLALLTLIIYAIGFADFLRLKLNVF